MKITKIEKMIRLSIIIFVILFIIINILLCSAIRTAKDNGGLKKEFDEIWHGENKE